MPRWAKLSQPTIRRFAIPVVVLSVLLLWATRTDHRIAPRTSPSFLNRPVSDALVKAVAKGDLKEINRLLDSGVSPNAGTKEADNGQSALSIAAFCEKVDAVKLLLNRGADVNADNFWGGNALIGASVVGNVEIVKLLLDHGADPNMEDDDVTALDYASHQITNHEMPAPIKNYEEIVRLLKARGATTSRLGRLIGWFRWLFPN